MQLFELNRSYGKKGTNLLYAIGLSIIIAIIMIVITIYSFYHSGAYVTAKQIKTGTKFVNSLDIGALDARAPINASDIDNYALSINSRLQALNDEIDFGIDDVSDSALGLQ